MHRHLDISGQTSLRDQYHRLDLVGDPRTCSPGLDQLVLRPRTFISGVPNSIFLASTFLDNMWYLLKPLSYHSCLLSSCTVRSDQFRVAADHTVVVNGSLLGFCTLHPHYIYVVTTNFKLESPFCLHIRLKHQLNIIMSCLICPT